VVFEANVDLLATSSARAAASSTLSVRMNDVLDVCLRDVFGVVKPRRVAVNTNPERMLPGTGGEEGRALRRWSVCFPTHLLERLSMRTCASLVDALSPVKMSAVEAVKSDSMRNSAAV
jgi:hypothetical protein